MAIPIYQLMGPVFKYLERPLYYVESRLLIFGMSFLLSLLVILLLKYVRISALRPPSWFKYGIVIIAVLATVLPHARLYWKWSVAKTFNTVNIAHDLAQIISPEAIVSGPYAADLTQDNRIRNLIHMFGVATVDSAFFKKYPITHLLIDKPNATAAAKQYPNIMKRADLVGQYYMPTRPVHLYRIAGVTGNVLADNYILSDYEMCRHFFRNNQIDSGYYYLNKFLNEHPENHAANFFAAEIAREKEQLETAIDFIGRAINFSPTDFYLRLRLGEYYIKMYKNSKNTDYMNKAKAEFDMATKFNPDSRRLKREIDNLLKGKERGEFE
jgi:tetratricopeptide (TPR) repeat protein